MTSAFREPKVAIIILNWNGWKDTIECLDSLNYLDYNNFEILLVDNASTNDSTSFIREAFPEVEIIENAENLGFAAGNNVAIHIALERGFDYIWLLNNDTTVSTLALKYLIEKAESNRNYGLLGSVLYEYFEPWKIQAWGGGGYSNILATTSTVKREGFKGQMHIIGASFFIPSSTFRLVGLLEERFFFFMEDTEFSLRVRDSGLDVDVAEKSFVFHKGGRSIDNSKQVKSLQSDVFYISSTAIFMKIRKYGMLLSLLRLMIIILRRIYRREYTRVPLLVREFVRGYRSVN